MVSGLREQANLEKEDTDTPNGVFSVMREKVIFVSGQAQTRRLTFSDMTKGKELRLWRLGDSSSNPVSAKY